MKNPRAIIIAAVLTLAAVGQIVLVILLHNPEANATIINIGWGILWLSALFGLLPIYTFRKWGGVPKGKGYIPTTILVDRGVYAIVRHPQYLAGILMSLALYLVSRHWAVALTGVLAMATSYISMVDEEASARTVMTKKSCAGLPRLPGRPLKPTRRTGPGTASNGNSPGLCGYRPGKGLILPKNFIFGWISFWVRRRPRYPLDISPGRQGPFAAILRFL
jgi:protein-S-isoprenylcysteine O-methyltransferase Ste14